jgi:putative ABC transport system permease protein
MRPPAPAAYHRTLRERLRLTDLAGPVGMIILRELERRPLRTVLSAVGVAAALALLVLGRFALDSVEAYVEGTLRREQRQDLAVTFDRPVSPRAARELASTAGVRQVEVLRAVAAKLRHEHRERDAVLVGLPDAGLLRQVVEKRGGVVRVPSDGVLVTRKLGEVLGLGIGDRPELALREGARPVVRPVVVGFVDESMGLQLYARDEVVARLQGDLGAVGSAMLTVDPAGGASIQARLRRFPRIIEVSELRADVGRLRDMQASIEDVRAIICTALAATVILGVVYNNARVSLATRARELGSLRVLGFSSDEIASILVGGMAVELILATPLGLYLGRSWARLVLQAADQEQFRWEAYVAPSTYVLAIAVVVLAAGASAVWVRRSLDQLDLIGVLKTRE